MNIKTLKLEVELYFLLKEKSLSDSRYDSTFANYVSYYQTNLTFLDEEDISFLYNYFLSNKPKKTLINELEVTEDKYYSDLRRILKKVERKLY